MYDQDNQTVQEACDRYHLAKVLSVINWNLTPSEIADILPLSADNIQGLLDAHDLARRLALTPLHEQIVSLKEEIMSLKEELLEKREEILTLKETNSKLEKEKSTTKK